MTAAVFGLVGVVIGALVNGLVTALVQHRSEAADMRSAARLVRHELVTYRTLAIESERRSPDDLPQLRTAGAPMWDSNRTVLARALSNDRWARVALAYAHVDALQSVLVYQQDGTLEPWRRREASRLLAELLDPATRAVHALGAAAGLAGSAASPDDADIPGDWPVAA